MAKNNEATYYAQPRKGYGFRFKNRKTGKLIECEGVEWYLNFKENGKRRRHKAHTELCRCAARPPFTCDHEKAAIKLVREYNAQFGLGIVDTQTEVGSYDQSVLSIEDGCKLYENHIKESRDHSESYWKNIRQTMKNFREWAKAEGLVKICEIRKDQAIRYSLYMQNENIARENEPVRLRKSNTVNRYLRELRAWFYILLDQGYVKENPFCEKRGSSRKVFLRVTDEKPITIFSDDELQLLLSLTADDLRPIVNSYAETLVMMVPLFYQTGMRLGEVCNLTFSQIRGSKIYIEPHHGWSPKWSIRRSIPLQSRIKEIIENQREAFPASEYVFNTAGNTHFDEKNIYHALRKVFEHFSIVGDTGLGVSPHTFRRTFCTQTLASNVPAAVVQEWMGHSKIEMTLKYYAKIPGKTDHYINEVDFITSTPKAELGQTRKKNQNPTCVCREIPSVPPV